ncbi:MAG: hypothetical protein PHY72_03725 [Candidatus Pacebacteria bacterium]|nr:hypothetical protein [Candidatus Paceibacterota bacterium]
MKNNFFEKVFIIIAVFLLVLIQQTILPAMGIFFLGFWPVFTFVFLAGVFGKGVFSLVVAFFAGALIDFISGAHFGIFTLSFFSIALIIKAGEQRLKFSNPFVVGVFFVFCALIFWGILHLLIYVF